MTEVQHDNYFSSLECNLLSEIAPCIYFNRVELLPQNRYALDVLKDATYC
jgi:hypothetical protein